MNDAGVVVHEDSANGECGYFGDEDTAEGVCYGGVDADEGEDSVEGFVFVELDLEVLRKKI